MVASLKLASLKLASLKLASFTEKLILKKEPEDFRRKYPNKILILPKS